MTLIVLSCLMSSAFSMPAEVIKENNAAVDSFAKKNYYQAYQGFLKGLSQEPFQPKLHLNLGRTFQQNEEYEKALQEYDLIQRLPQVDRQTLFEAEFNSGTVAQAQGQIPQALQFYQKALALQPDSIETKTNIELMWKSAQGKGSGKDKNDKNDKNNQENKDQKEGQGNPDKDQKDKQNKQDAGKDKDQKQESQSQKQQQKFESQQLSQEDVRKILEEIKNQEQQIRAEINRKEVKETPREKNW